MNQASKEVKKASRAGKWNKKQVGLAVGLGILVLAIAAGITACAILNGGEEETAAVATDSVEEAEETSSGLVYDESAVEGGWESLSEEEIVATLNEKVDEGMINISCNTSPVFADGTSEGNLMIVNEEINNYPQVVEIVLNDTNEVIYTSGAIPVGSKIETDTLDVVLEAGTYSCTALFHNVDPDTGNYIGTAGAVITITIQN